MDDFCDNYSAMMWQFGHAKHGADDNIDDQAVQATPLSLVMFVDSGLPIKVYFPRGTSDEAFLHYIAHFYYLQKIRKGLLEAASFKTLGVVEVVDIESHSAVGSRNTILKLGRYGGNRMIYFFRYPNKIHGNTLFKQLQQRGVLSTDTALPRIYRVSNARNDLESGLGDGVIGHVESPDNRGPNDDPEMGPAGNSRDDSNLDNDLAEGRPPIDSGQGPASSPRNSLEISPDNSPVINVGNCPIDNPRDGPVINPENSSANSLDAVSGSAQGNVSEVADRSASNNVQHNVEDDIQGIDPVDPVAPVVPAAPVSEPKDATRALNFVSTWHTNFAALAVVAPFVASLVVCIAWPAMAVLLYGEDMQISVQTGFTVGGYVVTAGALLVALVTFAAGVSDYNAKYTVGLDSEGIGA